MSFSLPVVGLNYGGAPQFIKSNVSLQLVDEHFEYTKIVKLLSKNIDYLFHNKYKRLEIGEENKNDLLKYFTWEAKAEKMITIYKKLLNEK